MLESFLQWMGYGLCHQLPERSLFGGGVQVPVCARDTGIYLGFMVSMLVVGLLHRPERPRGFPRWPAWIAIGCLVGFMGFDGVTSYAGLRETTNQLRLLSGLGAGFGIAAILVPILNDVLWVRADATRVLAPSWRLVSWIAAWPVTYLVVWYTGPLLGLGLPLLTAMGILGTLTAVNLAIVGMFPAFDRAARGYRDLLLPVALAFVLALAEIWLSGLVRAGLQLLASSVVR